MKSKKIAQVEEESVFVYLGPSIRGVIQSGTIYLGTRQQVKNNLQFALSKYPKIETLIVKDTEITEAKEKIKKGGNALSHAFKTLTEK